MGKEAHSPEQTDGAAEVVSLPIEEVEFTLAVQENTVSDGELKEGDYSFLTFPGVSSCIPIVISAPEEDRIIASIHAKPSWTPERLSHAIESIRQKTEGPILIEYAERVLPPKIGESWVDKLLPGTLEDPRRKTLLEWLEKEAGNHGMEVEQVKVSSPSLVIHLGYKRGTGFVRLKIVVESPSTAS